MKKHHALKTIISSYKRVYFDLVVKSDLGLSLLCVCEYRPEDLMCGRVSSHTEDILQALYSLLAQLGRTSLKKKKLCEQGGWNGGQETKQEVGKHAPDKKLGGSPASPGEKLEGKKTWGKAMKSSRYKCNQRACLPTEIYSTSTLQTQQGRWEKRQQDSGQTLTVSFSQAAASFRRYWAKTYPFISG